MAIQFRSGSKLELFGIEIPLLVIDGKESSDEFGWIYGGDGIDEDAANEYFIISLLEDRKPVKFSLRMKVVKDEKFLKVYNASKFDFVIEKSAIGYQELEQLVKTFYIGFANRSMVYSTLDVREDGDKRLFSDLIRKLNDVFGKNLYVNEGISILGKFLPIVDVNYVEGRQTDKFYYKEDGPLAIDYLSYYDRGKVLARVVVRSTLTGKELFADSGFAHNDMEELLKMKIQEYQAMIAMSEWKY